MPVTDMIGGVVTKVLTTGDSYWVIVEKDGKEWAVGWEAIIPPKENSTGNIGV